MDRKQQVGGGVKVTYIETSFVTSDAASFKDLVQRLTGKSPTAAGAKPAAPHKPGAFHAGGARTTAAAGAGAETCHYYRQAGGEVGPAAVASRAPPCQEDLLLGGEFFSDLFYVGAGEQRVFLCKD
nr:unnamed protein product [Digitaria exilis]